MRNIDAHVFLFDEDDHTLQNANQDIARRRMFFFIAATEVVGKNFLQAGSGEMVSQEFREAALVFQAQPEDAHADERLRPYCERPLTELKLEFSKTSFLQYGLMTFLPLQVYALHIAGGTFLITDLRLQNSISSVFRSGYC